MSIIRLLILLLNAVLISTSFQNVYSFSTPNTQQKPITSKTNKTIPKVNEIPKYDSKTQKWTPTGPNQLPDAGYKPIKTLLLQGPKPYLTRILQNDDYEQAVLKFMAGDKIISRDIAQGNMDAYLRNPQDWMYNRMESEKKGFDMNYTKLNTKDIILVISWSSIVLLFIGRILYSYVNGIGPFA